MAQRPSLFRQEAVDFQRHNREWGQVALLQPLSIKVTTWSITVVIALIISFLFLGQYSRKETVVGYLTPTSGTSKIFVPQLGTIREIHVNEGQQVREGQTLLTIDTDQIAANGLDVNATMVDTLRSQKDLLTGQIAAEEQRTKSERERLTATIGGIEIEISQLQAQQKIQGERIRVEEEFVASAAAAQKRRLHGGYRLQTSASGLSRAKAEPKLAESAARRAAEPADRDPLFPSATSNRYGRQNPRPTQ